jgi:hypothetical protein
MLNPQSARDERGLPFTEIKDEDTFEILSEFDKFA